MNQKNALFLCFIFWAGLITAQTDTFELSSYKARYERRPAMLLDGGMAFSGNYAEDNTAKNTGQASGRLFWREQRNTDELISSWYLSGNLTGNLNQNFSPSNGRYSTGALTLLSQWDRYHYRPGNRFWGWGGVFGTDGRLTSRPDNYRRFFTYITPTIFRGRGRIEFAEDALLASWMLDDLQQAGLIGRFSGNDITTLARTITDIIGNRTFDLRRRRIYELDRLQSTLLELGLSESESFELFAILNDNWAFANRNVLPHGNRLTYGAEGTAYRWLSRYEPSASNTLAYNGLAFLEYTRARVINKRSGGQWSLRAEAGYQQALYKFNSGDWQAPREGVFAELAASYTYRWFPSSRTSLSWANTASVNWGERDTGFIPTAIGLAFFDERAAWASLLELDYFINYQWSFRLRASSNLLYQLDTGLLSLSPNFTFNTVYYFF